MECSKQGTTQRTQDVSFLVTHPLILHLNIRARRLQSPSMSHGFVLLHHVFASLHNLVKGKKLVLFTLGLLTNSSLVLL